MSRQLQIIYRKIVSSIAFLPSIIGIFFFFLSIFSLYFDFSALGALVKNNMEVLLVKGNDNARQVLGALIGGIISLTVFSFSMVMLVINQAASNFTPRVIPGVVTDKKNQFVLGFYVGTIIYCIIMILNIHPGEESRNSPQIGVLIAMVLGIVCLSLFIYFIHLIAQKIQVDKILASASSHAIKKIEKYTKENPEHLFTPDTSDWYLLRNKQAGYISDISGKKLREVCTQNNLQVEILHPEGTYLLENDPVCKLNKNLHDKKGLQDSILSCFNFSYEPYGQSSYLYNINQITEIAVKALSPGINDPGTAIISMDHLMDVFNCLVQPKQKNKVYDPEVPLLVIIKKHSLQELLFNFVTPIHHYGKADARLQLKLINFYATLWDHINPDEKRVLKDQINELVASMEKHIELPSQKEILESRLKDMFPVGYFSSL